MLHPDSYRERAARISTWVALAFFALFVPLNLNHGDLATTIVDGLVCVMLLVHLVLLRRLEKPLVTAIVATVALLAVVLSLGLQGHVQAYFWANAAPLPIFFFAGPRRGAMLSAVLFAALVVLLVVVPPRQVTSDAQLSIVLSFLLIVISAFVNERQRLRYETELQRMSDTDPLTGIANRRRFHDLLETEHDRARRYQRSYSLLVVDADDFKAVNDRFGHDTGDEVLRAVTAALLAGVRSTDEAKQ